MRRVIWTDEAVDNLTRIRTYIGQFNEPAAQRLAGRLLAAADSLVVQPDGGRPIGSGRRELVSLAPDLIRYVVKDEAWRSPQSATARDGRADRLAP